MRITANQKQEIANATLVKLDALANRRQVWQRDFFDKSNKGLYALLSECLGMYYEIKGSSAEKAVLENIKITLDSRGVKVQASTPVLTLIVKYVFNAERRRASAYSRALRVAAKELISVKDFAEWVTKVGGIEEVASTKGITDETIQKRGQLDTKVAEVKQLLVNQLQHPLALVPKTALAHPADSAEYTLLIGKMLASGQTQVLSVVPGSTTAMIDQAIRKIAQELVNKVEEHVKAQAELAAQAAISEAANQAFFKEMA
ncbi:hypothetical protein G6700_05125 [Polynucleobacter paneuropaeus]|jgi:hypothetical protein|nr:hypothetical protein G6700_05125 [Polynucleobacter paneuropaeus]